MSANTKICDFFEFVRKIFGDSLANKIRSEDDIIETNQLRCLNENTIHPLIEPIYNELTRHRLSAKAWVLIYERILLCKRSNKYDIRHVYRALYETFTDTVVRASLFDVVPIEEKKIWYENYTYDKNVIKCKEKYVEHLYNCLEQAQELEKLCKKLRINVPTLDTTEFFKEVNTYELAISKAAEKQKDKASSFNVGEQSNIDKTQLWHESTTEDKKNSECNVSNQTVPNGKSKKFV